MDIKKISLITILVLLLGINCCLAGETTITGTASCYMPNLIEFKSQATASTHPSLASLVPIPSGASGKYEVQKEEKLVQTESNAVATNASGAQIKVTIYTVCAK